MKGAKMSESKKIDLAPPKKDSKKEPRSDKKEKPPPRFGVYRPAQVIAKKVEEIKEKEKKEKESVRLRYKAKESAKDHMEVEDPKDEIKEPGAWGEESGVIGKDWAEIGEKEKSESAPDEVKMDDRDIAYKAFDIQSFLVPHLVKNTSISEFTDWRQGLKDAFDSIKALAENSDAVMDKAKYSKWTQNISKQITVFRDLISKGLNSASKELSNPADQLLYVASDLDSIDKQLKEEDKKEFVPKKIQATLNLGFLSVFLSLIREVQMLREQNQLLLLSLDNYIKELLDRKWKADQRVYQIERVMEKWVKEEEEVPKEKGEEKKKEIAKKREEKRLKIKEENIEKYKKEKSWIEKEEWEKMPIGERVLKRWKFTDQHQIMDTKSWRSLNKEQKKDFLEKKKAWREARGKEIEKEIEKDKAKGSLMRRIFNFYNFRYKNTFGTFNTDGRKVENFRFRAYKSKKKGPKPKKKE